MEVLHHYHNGNHHYKSNSQLRRTNLSTLVIYNILLAILSIVCIFLSVPSFAQQQQPYYYQQHNNNNQPYQQQRQQTTNSNNNNINNNRLFVDQHQAMKNQEPRTSAFDLSPDANYAQQHHRQQLNRNNQILSQQRYLLAQPQNVHGLMLLNNNNNINSDNHMSTINNNNNNNNDVHDNMNMINNIPPSSAAITAISFNNLQHPNNGDSSTSAGTIASSASTSQLHSGNGNLDCTDKLCYGLPMGCNPPQLALSNSQQQQQHTPVTYVNDESCTAWITARQIVDNSRPVARDILFELYAKATGGSSWTAAGFSDNGRMKGFAFDCIHNKDAQDQPSVTIEHSYNLPGAYTNVAATVLNGFRPLKSSIDNGYYYCRWLVESAIEFSYKATNGTIQVRREDLGYKNYHLLMATGDYEASTNNKAPHTDRVSSFAPVSLAQFGQLKSTASHILVRIHGSLMVIIWAGLVTSSIIIARYYKNEWANSKLNDIALWFVIHRTLMLTAWFGSIIAVIFAYMYTETYHPGVHQLCGTTCLLLSTLQVIGGVFRPSLESSKRAYFSWAHFISGNLAHTFGMICLISASFLAPAHLPAAYLWVVVAFIATYAIVHIIMTIHQYVMHKSSKISITPMNDLNSNSSTTYTSGVVADSFSKGVGSPFRQFMLGIFVTLAIIFVCLLVILISNKPN